MKTPRFFFVEVTDVYGGEANYSWVTRHKVRASTMRGAVNRVSRDSGLHWHCVGDYGDQKRFDSASGATCLFVSDWSDGEHGELFHVNEL